VSGNRHSKSIICVVVGTLAVQPARPKKKAGLFKARPLPFKTPVSGIILPSAASKKQHLKATKD
jgi:hypothetical protein